MRYFIFTFIILSFVHTHLLAKEFLSKIVNNQGRTIGAIKAMPTEKGVLLEIKVKNLTAGKHGMHIHEVADCSDLNTFQRSGGHVTKENAEHGFLNQRWFHAGDLPNLIVHRDGSARVEIYAAGLQEKLAGSALVIHAQPDDHQSQPIGGSGARIACAEIK